MVWYARFPEIHPYMISKEYFDGRRIDILRTGADLSWSGQISYFWRSLSLRHCLIRAGNVLLRMGYMDVGGRGVLFAGGDAGEQMTLWAKYRGAGVINHDRSAIGVEEVQPMAYGVPLLGSGHICQNQTLPLAAIVLAEKGAKNTVVPLTGPQAMAAVRPYMACDAWRDGEYAAALSLLDDVLGRTAVLEMNSSGGEAAVKQLEKQLKALD